MEKIKEKIRSIIALEILEEGNTIVIEDSMSIIDDIGLDSIQILQLIATLEREFEITFSGEDLDLNNFESINTIAEVIESYK